MTMTPTAEYTASDIRTLEGLEAVRARPGMYIGGTGSEGLMHLVWEILDNAIDEGSAGFATKATLTFHTDGSVSVSDNGRGIPVGLHPELGVSAVEVVFTELHAGGKFGGSAYSASGGLHGVGASVVNALSTRLDVTVSRDDKQHSLSFSNGTPGHWQNGTFKESHDLKVSKAKKGETGTTVRFWPDLELFDPQAEFDTDDILVRVQQVCYLVPGLTVCISNENTGTWSAHQSKNGIADLVKDRSGNQKPVTPILRFQGEEAFTEKVSVSGSTREVERICEVDVALQWVDGYETDVTSYVNTIPTTSGGTHLAGFEKSLTRAVNNSLVSGMRKLSKLSKQGQNKALRDDIQEGLVAAVKVTFPEPQFRGQTKQTLGTPAAETATHTVVYAQLKEWFETNNSHVKALANKIANAVIARVEARQKLETRRKAARTQQTAMPDKLADCRVHGNEAELILVEGDSAAGPAKRGRNSETMAILPLRGKIVNAAKAKPKEVLANAEAHAIITALGAGIGQDFDFESARYGRIIILCDADVDGSHIRCLLLTLIDKYLKPMLTTGRVYAAQPPLFSVKVGGQTYRAYSESERDHLTEKLTRGKTERNLPWQRFKGLGEMNTDELRHCALDPATRTLKQLTMSDATSAKAAAHAFDVLMGSNVEKRRVHIAKNSQLMDRDLLDI